MATEMEERMLLRVIHILSTVFVETICVLLLVSVARFESHDLFSKLHDGLEQPQDVDGDDDVNVRKSSGHFSNFFENDMVCAHRGEIE